MNRHVGHPHRNEASLYEHRLVTLRESGKQRHVFISAGEVDRPAPSRSAVCSRLASSTAPAAAEVVSAVRPAAGIESSMMRLCPPTPLHGCLRWLRCNEGVG